jgi:hypothetical protein
MMKILCFVLFLLPSLVWSCPNCHVGVSDSARPPYTLIILGAFIVLTYIPFYILFRAAKKYDPSQNGN